MPYGGIADSMQDVFGSDVDGEELCPVTFNTMKINK